MERRRRVFRAFATVAVAATAALGSLSGAQAQEIGEPGEELGISCFVAPARLSDADLRAFLEDPRALLTEYSEGGLPLQNRVRALVGSSSAAFEALLALIPEANAGQAAAIGAGLARVVNACTPIDADYADRILAAVGELDNQDLLVAFSGALHQAPVGAIASDAAGGPSVSGAAQLTEGPRNAPGSNNRSFGGDVTVLNEEGAFLVGSAGNFVAASASPFAP